MSIYDEKFLNKDYYFRHSYGYYTMYQNHNLRNTAHSDVEIMGVVKGECIIPMENEMITLRAGEFIFIDSNVIHGLIVEKPCKMYCVHFRLVDKPIGVKFSDLVKNEYRMQKMIDGKEKYFVLKDYEDLAYSAKQYHDALSLYRSYYASLLQAEMLLKIATLYCQSRLGIGSRVEYIKKAFSFIWNNMDKGIALQEVADHVNLNPSYFGRIFKKHAGMTLVEYINNCRINKAKIFLNETDMSIIEICERIGFGSRQYFTHLFTRKEGVSPQKFRSMHRKM